MRGSPTLWQPGDIAECIVSAWFSLAEAGQPSIPHGARRIVAEARAIALSELELVGLRFVGSPWFYHQDGFRKIEPVVPRHCAQSAAAHSPGGSGLEGGSHSALQPFPARSPVTGDDIAETAIAARGSRQSSDDCLSQHTNVDRIFHEGEFI